MESEASTRKTRIDPRLEAAGWSAVPFASQLTEAPPAASAVQEWPTAVERWAGKHGLKLPGKRVVASRLVEEGLANPSNSGTQALKQVHKDVSAILRAPGA